MTTFVKVGEDLDHRVVGEHVARRDRTPSETGRKAWLKISMTSISGAMKMHRTEEVLRGMVADALRLHARTRGTRANDTQPSANVMLNVDVGGGEARNQPEHVRQRG